MSGQPKTGKRIQIYLDSRHVEWWHLLPRWERSRIVAESLDLYRESKIAAQISRAAPSQTPNQPHGDAENERSS